MTTAASRSTGSCSRTLSVARMPPADPTMATTSTGGASTDGIALQQHRSDRAGLLERFLGEAVETAGGELRAGAARTVGNPAAQLRALEQRTQRHPERRLEVLRLSR